MLSIARLFVVLFLSWATQAQSSDADEPLRVLVPLKTGFKAFVWSEDNQTFHGFSIQVFQAAVAQLNPPFAYKFVGYGDNRTSPRYDTLLSLLQAKKVDAVVADITINRQRIQVADFTQPYEPSALVVVIPVSSPTRQSLWGFLRPFSWKLWIAIATAFLATGFVILILEEGNTDFQGPWHKRFLNVYWFIGLSLFFSQRDRIHSQPGRLVTVLWLLVVLIFTSSYTANLSSSLTSERLSTEITGFESLKRMDVPVGYQTGSLTYECLIRLGIKREKLVALDTELEYKIALEKGPQQHGGVAAIVDELPYVTKFLASDCDFKIVGNQIAYFGGLAFAFPKNSSLTQKMSWAILSIAKKGTLQAIKNETLGTNTCSLQTPANHLKFSNFAGLFMILGAVYGFSVLWPLGRLIWIVASKGIFHLVYIVRKVLSSLWTHARSEQKNRSKVAMGVYHQNQQVRPDTEIDMSQ